MITLELYRLRDHRYDFFNVRTDSMIDDGFDCGIPKRCSKEMYSTDVHCRVVIITFILAADVVVKWNPRYEGLVIVVAWSLAERHCINEHRRQTRFPAPPIGLRKSHQMLSAVR